MPVVLDLGIAAVVVLFVAGPAIFTHWGFGPDFTNHLWLVWQQGIAISAHHQPTLFMQSSIGGVFQPFYGFYGGTLYALVGGLSGLSGNHPNAAYDASIVGGIAMAYGGVWWLSRQMNLPRLLCHVPAFIFVSSAYYVTNIYARGAWPEFVALSALPLVIAAGIWLLREPWSAGSVALFAVGCVLVSGSHNISLLWDTIVVGMMLIVVLAVVGPADRPGLRRCLAVLALAGVAVGVNAWFLVLDILHGKDTVLWGQGFHWGTTSFFNTPGALLNPLRITPAQSTTSGLSVVAPVLALAIAVILLGVGRRQAARESLPLRRIWWVVAGVLVCLLALMMTKAAWEFLGAPFTLIQFPYRLSGLVALAVTVLLALSLRLVGTAPWARRVVPGVLAGLVLVTAAQAAWQLWNGDSLKTFRLGHNRFGAFAHGPTGAPDTWYGGNAYGDSSRGLVATDPGRSVTLPIPPPGATSLSAVVTLPPGYGPVATNISGGPYAVSIKGVSSIGRTADGFTVISRLPNKPLRTRITVTAFSGLRQTAAELLSIASILVLVGLLTTLAVRRRTLQAR